jgi:hypothetical protein
VKLGDSAYAVLAFATLCLKSIKGEREREEKAQKRGKRVCRKLYSGKRKQERRKRKERRKEKREKRRCSLFLSTSLLL